MNRPEALAVREVGPDELVAVLAGLVALEAELFGDEAWDAEALRGLARTTGRRVLVAETHGRLLGWSLTGLVGDFSELLRIGTTAAVQRSGVATALLEAALAGSAVDGAERMLLEVSEHNAAARAFYARHGFVEIDRRPSYYRDGAAALVCERPLVSGHPDGGPEPRGRMEP